MVVADKSMSPIGAGSGKVGSPSKAEPPRHRKRPSPPAAGVAPTLNRSDKVKDLANKQIEGAKNDIMNRITVPAENLALTKCVNALEQVADQTTGLVRGVKDVVMEDTDRLTEAILRIETLEARIGETDEALKQSIKNTEQLKNLMDGRLQTMMDEANQWETKLDTQLKAQNKDVQDKLKETADTFVNCDKILVEIKAMRNTAEHFVGSTVPAAAGPASALSAAQLLQTQQQRRHPA